jgi:hypothetical protein
MSYTSLIPLSPPGRRQEPVADPSRRATRWGALPMVKFCDDAATVRKQLPLFDRVSTDFLGLGNNPNFDLVVRRPGPDCFFPVPVGMVSKTYRIVQHSEILDRVCGYASKIPGAKPGNVEVSMTANGERVIIHVDLGEAWVFSPDGEPVGMQVICRNSVDGSSAIRLHLGWFRFVCSNGMVVGVTLGKARMAHKKMADMNLAFAPIEQQLEFVKKERENLNDWAQTPVSNSAIRKWVDTKVLEKWNSLSAARVWNICQKGKDAKFLPPFERALPSHRHVKLLEKVPGAPEAAKTLYDAAQALSFVASRRTDVDDAESHQRDIGALIEMLKCIS